LNGDGVEDSYDTTVRGVDTVTLAAPSSPVVTVWGVLINGYTGEPIQKADLEILTSKNHILKGKTDEQGAFMINAVSPGAFRLVATVAGFMPLRVLGNVNGNIGITDNFSNISATSRCSQTTAPTPSRCKRRMVSRSPTRPSS